MITDYPFRWIFMPYCLKQLTDGRYIVLNRQYKPLGVASSKWVAYEDHPSATTLDITPALARQLSWKGSDSVEVIHLYNDGCLPDDGRDHLAAYSERLGLLMKLRTRWD